MSGSKHALTVIDGGGKKIPVLTIKGTKNVTITNLTFRNGGKEGILFTDHASGKLIKVIAHNTNEGIVIDGKSHVKLDNVIASDNNSLGIRVANGSRARFMELERTENQCSDPDVKLNNLLEAQSVLTIQPIVKTLFLDKVQPFLKTEPIEIQPVLKTFSFLNPTPPTASDTLFSMINTISASTTQPCFVVASNNGIEQPGYGIVVDGDLSSADIPAGTSTKLEIDNCSVNLSGKDERSEMAGNQGTGLEIINGGNVTTRGATLIIEGNSFEGIYMSDASTLELNSFSPEIQSKIESNSNNSGIEMFDSSLILYDKSEFGVRNNTENGAFFSEIQSLTCDSETQFIISNNDPNVEIEGVIPEDGEDCITESTDAAIPSS